MKNTIHLPLPAIKALHKIGKDINDARRRRRITSKLMAERAGLSRATVGKIEKGDPSTSIGGYASVLFVLGMIDQLSDLMDASHDLTGRQLDAEKLPKRVRFPSKTKTGKDHE